MRKAKSNYDPAMVLGVIGGALVGWPLGTAIGGGDPNWTLAAIGDACIIGSIPLGSAFNKHAIRGHRLIQWKRAYSCICTTVLWPYEQWVRASIETMKLRSIAGFF